MVIADSKSAECLFFRQNKIQESPSFLLKHHQYIGAQGNNPICSSPTQTPTQKEPLPLQHPSPLHLTIMLPFLCRLWPGVRHRSLGHTAQKSLSALTLINHGKAGQAPGAGSLARGWGVQCPHHPSALPASAPAVQLVPTAPLRFRRLSLTGCQRVRDAAENRVHLLPSLCLSDQSREREACYRSGCTAWRVFSKLPLLSLFWAF